MSKKVITLIGSTRGKKTASESIVNYLFNDVNEVELRKYRAHEIFNKKEKLDVFMNDLKDGDILLISSPVYVHSLPYPLTVVLEQMAGKEFKSCWQSKKILAVFHSGYPEDIQRKASFKICENFANETSMKWMGGLGFGGSPLIAGRPLEEVGSFTKWMRKSLDELRISLIEGNEISADAYKMAKKHFPPYPSGY